MPTDGLFYGSVKPLQLDTGAAKILQEMRADFRLKQKARVDKIKKDRENLGKNIYNPKVKYALNDAVPKVRGQITEFLLQDYKDMNSGKITEAERLSNSAKYKELPRTLESLSQVGESVLLNLYKGDESLNAEVQNKLLTELNTIKDVKIDRDGILMIKHKTIDEDGNVVEVSESADDWRMRMTSYKSVPKVGDPDESAIKFGRGFRADLEKSDSPTGGVLKSGMKVGSTRERFETSFSGMYGNREDGDNPYVLKQAGLGGDYAKAWDTLHDLAASQIDNKFMKTYRNPPTVKTTGGTGDILSKLAVTPIPEIGNPNKKLTKITDADGNTVKGIGVSYKVPDSSKKITVDLGSYQAKLGQQKIDIPKKIKVDNIFVDENNNMWVRGSIDRPELLEVVMSDNNINETTAKTLIKSAIAGGSSFVGWTKIEGKDYSNVQANIFKGIQPVEVYNYVTGSGGNNDEPQSSSPTSPSNTPQPQNQNNTNPSPSRQSEQNKENENKPKVKKLAPGEERKKGKFTIKRRNQ